MNVPRGRHRDGTRRPPLRTWRLFHFSLRRHESAPFPFRMTDSPEADTRALRKGRFIRLQTVPVFPFSAHAGSADDERKCLFRGISVKPSGKNACAPVFMVFPTLCARCPQVLRNRAHDGDDQCRSRGCREPDEVEALRRKKGAAMARVGNTKVRGDKKSVNRPVIPPSEAVRSPGRPSALRHTLPKEIRFSSGMFSLMIAFPATRGSSRMAPSSGGGFTGVSGSCTSAGEETGARVQIPASSRMETLQLQRPQGFQMPFLEPFTPREDHPG